MDEEDGLGTLVVPVARIEPVVLVDEVELGAWIPPAVLLTPAEIVVVVADELQFELISTWKHVNSTREA